MNKILIDTHVFIWWIADDKDLNDKHRSLIADPMNLIYVSDFSLFEISIKQSIGKLEFRNDPYLLVNDCGFNSLSLKKGDLEIFRRLPFHHKDPFDRILIAQAINQDLKVISYDKQFAPYRAKLV